MDSILYAEKCPGTREISSSPKAIVLPFFVKRPENSDFSSPFNECVGQGQQRPSWHSRLCPLPPPSLPWKNHHRRAPVHHQLRDLSKGKVNGTARRVQFAHLPRLVDTTKLWQWPCSLTCPHASYVDQPPFWDSREHEHHPVAGLQAAHTH